MNEIKKNNPQGMNWLPVNEKTRIEKKSQTLRCSLCGQPYQREASPCMPFCSQRCQQIDLGNWLNEDYGLPYEGEGTPETDYELDDSQDGPA